MINHISENNDSDYPFMDVQPKLSSYTNTEPVLSVGLDDSLLVLWGAVIFQKAGIQLAEFTVKPKNATLLFVNRGKLKVAVDGKPYAVSPGQALVIKENETCVGTEPHQVELSCQWLTFEMEPRAHANNNSRVDVARITDVGDPSIVMELFRLITEEFHKHQAVRPGVSSNDQASQFLLMSLLSRIRPAESSMLPASDALTALAERARDYMRANADKPCTIADVADHMECSDGYLRTAFRLTYGYSPGRFLLRVRIHRARYLLRRTRLTIDQVAKECGYNDASYFSRVFTRENGTTPSRYRRAHSRQYVTQGI